MIFTISGILKISSDKDTLDTIQAVLTGEYDGNDAELFALEDMLISCKRTDLTMKL